MIQVAVVKNRNMRASAVSIFGLLLAIVHFASVAVVFGLHHEGSWGYVLFVIPDFPVMLVLALLNIFVPMSLVTSWLFVGVIGSIWWYLIGVWLQRLFLKRTKK